jgi:hypothetical protein
MVVLFSSFYICFMGRDYPTNPQKLPLAAATELVNKVSKGKGVYTNKEMMCLPEGTTVRIKSNVDAHEEFHNGGALVFQTLSELEDGESLYGILTASGICWDFRAEDYEVVSLEMHPIWLQKYPGSNLLIISPEA